MTVTQASPEVNELRTLFRYLQEWRSLYEAQGIDELTTPLGRTWSLWDLEHLYSQAASLLTPAQYRALTLFLVFDIKERDAAITMGVSPTNPVGMYAALGLARLLDSINSGEVERFLPDHEGWKSRRMAQSLKDYSGLASRLREQTRDTLTGCWQFLPTRPGQAPQVRLRSLESRSGFLYVHPMWIMYLAEFGPLPPGYALAHRAPREPHHPACINPDHGRFVRHALHLRRIP